MRMVNCEGDDKALMVSRAWWDETFWCMKTCTEGEWYVNGEEKQDLDGFCWQSRAKFRHDFLILHISTLNSLDDTIVQ